MNKPYPFAIAFPRPMFGSTVQHYFLAKKGFLMSNILEQLIPIFRDVFDDDELVLKPSTTAQDVDGWDSLAHIRLVVSIEKAFKLRFSAAEVSSLKNVGEMADLVGRKLNDA